MPKRWHQFRNPWDREYAMRGALWRGVSDASFLLARVRSGTLCVELGCGDGKFVAGLASAGYRAVGIDFSRHALAQAKARGAKELALADVRSLPLRGRSVPFVAARYVLGALDADGRVRASGEIRRVLAPDGILLVEEFSTTDFRAAKGREVEPATFERNRGILTHYFERDEVDALFPGLRRLSTEEVVSEQRTGTTRSRRHRWRWVLGG